LRLSGVFLALAGSLASLALLLSLCLALVRLVLRWDVIGYFSEWNIDLPPALDAIVMQSSRHQEISADEHAEVLTGQVHADDAFVGKRLESAVLQFPCDGIDGVLLLGAWARDDLFIDRHELECLCHIVRDARARGASVYQGRALDRVRWVRSEGTSLFGQEDADIDSRTFSQ
jgi:hypothetical protein